MRSVGWPARRRGSVGRGPAASDVLHAVGLPRRFPARQPAARAVVRLGPRNRRPAGARRMIHLPEDAVFTAARHALALLHREADAVRKELAALRRDIVDARLEFDGT